MRTPQQNLRRFGIALVALALAAGVTWLNLRIVGNDPEMTGFSPQWMGARQALLERADPYSESFRQEVQQAALGREAFSWEDPHDFLYPYYAILLYLPVALIAQYPLALSVWMTLLAAALVGLARASLALTHWEPPPAVVWAYGLFVVFNYHALRAVLAGNPAPVVALGITLAFLAIQHERDLLAGSLLAWTTIKPQIVVLLLPFVVIWAVSRRRRGILAGMGLTLLVLFAVSSILQPGWLVESLAQMAAFPHYTTPESMGEALAHGRGLAGVALRWMLTAGLAGLVVYEWWGALGKDFRWFLWTAALTLTVTQMIGIPTSTSNYVVLIPAVTLTFSIWEQHWRGKGQRFILIIMLGLLGGIWWLHAVTSGLIGDLYQAPVMFFPLPLFTFVTLYWIRYWALGSVRLQVKRLDYLKNL